MKNIKFKKSLVPALACLTLLVGCSNAPKLSSKNETVTTLSGDSYQYMVNKLYNTIGVDTTVEELLARVADYVLSESSFWGKADGEGKKLYETEIEKRVLEEMDKFYSNTSYKDDGLFDEDLLADELISQGYKVSKKDGETELTPYRETGAELLGKDKLTDKLGYDYSDYVAEKSKEVKLTLLKEEYVRTQKGYDADGKIITSYFSSTKKFRNVEYFEFTPELKDRLEFNNKFTTAIKEFDQDSDTFRTFVYDTLAVEWKCKQLDDLAKDFALINGKAGLVNEDSEYPLPAVYTTAAEASELAWETGDEKYSYRPIYTAEDRAELTAEQIEEVKEKLNEYSNSGKQSIYKGYYLKQLAIVTADFYHKSTYCTESSNVINATVTNAIKSVNDYKYSFGDGDNKTTLNILDINKTGSPVYKSGDTSYVIYSSELDFTAQQQGESQEDFEARVQPQVIEACKVLATSSSNVKNCWYYYLTELENSGKFSVNWQDVYDYLNTTYSFGEKD